MRSEVWRPAAAARNRAPGGPGHRPPGTIRPGCEELAARAAEEMLQTEASSTQPGRDRKSTRLNSSHLGISYAVFCLKKKKKKKNSNRTRNSQSERDRLH